MHPLDALKAILGLALGALMLGLAASTGAGDLGPQRVMTGNLWSETDICKLDVYCDDMTLKAKAKVASGLYANDGERLRQGLFWLAKELQVALMLMAAISLTVVIGGAAFGGGLAVKKMTGVLVALAIGSGSGAIVGLFYDEQARDVLTLNANELKLPTVMP